MRVTAKLADILSKRIKPTGASWEKMRDHLDIECGGEFDTKQLDMITDMVQSRHAKANGE
jgi:hypothetical protein